MCGPVLEGGAVKTLDKALVAVFVVGAVGSAIGAATAVTPIVAAVYGFSLAMNLVAAVTTASDLLGDDADEEFAD